MFPLAFFPPDIACTLLDTVSLLLDNILGFLRNANPLHIAYITIVKHGLNNTWGKWNIRKVY